MSITRSDDSRYGRLHGGTQPSGSAQHAAHTETLRFRTPNPIPYPERDETGSLTVDRSLFCEGECEWTVCDAPLFGATCVPGAKLNEQLENELSLALELALTKLSQSGAPAEGLTGRSDEIGNLLAEDLFPLWRERRGIQATRFRLTSAEAPKPDAGAPAALRLEPSPNTPAGDAWTCPRCGKTNHGNFCPGCGEKRPE